MSRGPAKAEGRGDFGEDAFMSDIEKTGAAGAAGADGVGISAIVGGVPKS